LTSERFKQGSAAREHESFDDEKEAPRGRRCCATGGSPSVPRFAGAVDDNLKSQGRSRLASTPVRPQLNVTELAAVGKQTDLETERLRLKTLAIKSAVKLAREKTPPPPPPPLKQ
jgi:hypothetical protein